MFLSCGCMFLGVFMLADRVMVLCLMMMMPAAWWERRLVMCSPLDVSVTCAIWTCLP